MVLIRSVIVRCGLFSYGWVNNGAYLKGRRFITQPWRFFKVIVIRENCVLAHPFGPNSFLVTQLSITQKMSTVAQKNIPFMHYPLFIISFPKLPLQPTMSAAISLSVSAREVVFLIIEHKNIKL